ncbi:signal peptidase I [Thermoactinomyces sp. DSM 45892]|uniref:signal peptidase I n=1 Tax=Thermoactinomyces sp. DSM 45892 TaxID=1882753 RepID=UPI00089A7B83|nr:signal peptidase I [Thermoactinomyces sp. DSM 45892]SDX97929.1 signal peptidase I [Thermoactinomyces sp. DSM 45892]
MDRQEFIPRSERLKKQQSQNQSSLPSRSRRNRGKEKGKNSYRDWAIALIAALVLAFLIRGFVLEPFHVSGPSMQNTLASSDKVMVNKLIYKIRSPKQGEVVVFRSKDKVDLIKRIVALPGETVEVKNNQLLVNGKEVKEPYLSTSTKTADFAMVKVPNGQVFVLGDNRSNSTDSRVLGPVSTDEIIGKASFVYWPIAHFSGL